MPCELYSPYNPEFYRREGEGHGEWYRNDLPKWNLVWLSVPQLDLYHDPRLTVNQITSMIDHEYVGTVTAGLNPEIEDIFPTLRKLLEMPKADFFHRFMQGPWSSLPAYNSYGMRWIDTMRSRANREGLNTTAHNSAISAESRVVSNVIDFGAYKRRS